MVQDKAGQTQRYVEAQRGLESDGYARDPAWVRSLRASALSRFQELGFPTARRGNEEWKYTDVGPIARVPFQPTISTTKEAAFSVEELESLTLGEPEWHRIAFVDGRLREDLSSLDGLPGTVRVMSLPQAIVDGEHGVRENLGRLAAFESDGFAALNTAFLREGVYVHMADRAEVEHPIHIVHLLTIAAHEAVAYPRVLIVAGSDARATLIETYAAEGDIRSLSNGVTEIVVGPGAAVDRYTMQLQSEQTFGIATAHAEVHENARFNSVYTDIGGALVRNNLSVDMVGEGGYCTLNGSYLVTRDQHIDNQVIIEHKAAHTGARELYKGILDGRSRSVFHGSIIVREGAVKVDALQEDKNLLLSDEAEADTKPAFWIYCDDVRCGHGAACGAIDQDAIFYLRSRGLDEVTARHLLVRGFVAEIVDTISHQGVRRHVDRLVSGKLADL